MVQSVAEVGVSRLLEAIMGPHPDQVEGLPSRHAVAVLVSSKDGGGVQSLLAALARREVFAIPGSQQQIPPRSEQGPFVRVYADEDRDAAVEWMKRYGAAFGGGRIMTVHLDRDRGGVAH